jgi:hypothetical protein
MGNPGDPALVIVGAYRHVRTLSNKLLSQFCQACENDKPEIALQLLEELESFIRARSRPNSVQRRKLVDKLIAAHERLWDIMHPAKLLTGELAEVPATCRKIIH